MTIRLLCAAAALAALAACGQQPASTTTAPADATNSAAAAPDNTLAQIEGLSETARNGVFFRAIRDSGYECQEVTQAVSKGDVDGRPTWVATCHDGSSWGLSLASGGVMRVTQISGAR